MFMCATPINYRVNIAHMVGCVKYLIASIVMAVGQRLRVDRNNSRYLYCLTMPVGGVIVRFAAAPLRLGAQELDLAISAERVRL